MDKSAVVDQRLVSAFDSPVLARDAILYFANSRLHYDNEHRYEQAFYGRRIRPHILKFLDYSSSPSGDAITSYAAFSANRLLASMYEGDFLLLPTEAAAFVARDFDEFYDPNRRIAAAIAIPYLERYLFNFLAQEIKLSGQWTPGKVQGYFLHYAAEVRKQQCLPSARAIAESSDPPGAARDWLIQLAPDFLLESSPMARYASGSYGAVGSSLFKIIIDELGYGDFRRSGYPLH